MSLDIRPLELDGVLEVPSRKIGDDRGYLFGTWNAQKLSNRLAARR